jgi:hypothetical protein
MSLTAPVRPQYIFHNPPNPDRGFGHNLHPEIEYLGINGKLNVNLDDVKKELIRLRIISEKDRIKYKIVNDFGIYNVIFELDKQPEILNKGEKGEIPGKSIGKVNNEEVLALGGGGGGGPRVSVLRALTSAGGRGNLEKPRGHSVGPRASAEVAKLDEFTLVKVSPGVWRIEGAPEDVFLTVPAGGGNPILSPAAIRYFSSSTSRSRKRTRKMRR